MAKQQQEIIKERALNLILRHWKESNFTFQNNLDEELKLRLLSEEQKKTFRKKKKEILQIAKLISTF